MRTKALGHFLGSVRPLHFDHYSPTPSKRTHAQASAQPAAHASAAAHKATTAASISSAGGAGGGEAGAGTDATAAEDGAKGKKTGADLVPTKPEKRKYVFKNRPAPAAPPATGILFRTWLFSLCFF